MAASRKPAVIFSKCLGLNDTDSTLGAFSDTNTGETEVTAIDGLTYEDQGKLGAIGNNSVLATFAGTILAAKSNGKRAIVHCGTTLFVYENAVITQVTLSGSVINVGATPVKIFFTPSCAYVQTATVSYKIWNTETVATLTAVGTWTGPPTSVAWAAIPTFDGGFFYNGRVFTWKGKFLQASAPWHNDNFNLPDDYIAMPSTILQAGSIKGCIVVLCSDCVVTLVGDRFGEYQFKKYPIVPINNSLASRYSDRAGEFHMFVSTFGVYTVESDGKLTNVTASRLENLSSFSALGAAITQTSYVCRGATKTIEYNFDSQGAITQTHSAISGMVLLNEKYTSVVGATFVTYGAVTSVDCSISFPLSDFSTYHRKKTRSLYVYGNFVGTLTISVGSASKVVTLTAGEKAVRITGFSASAATVQRVSLSFTGTVFHLNKIDAIYSVSQSNS